MKTLTKYEELTIQWAKDRRIIPNATSATQTLKLVSEVGELADNINKGRDVKDDIGDCLVCLTNIAALEGTNLTECWAKAYNDIKDRTGYMTPEGCFIKDGDDIITGVTRFDNELHINFKASQAKVVRTVEPTKLVEDLTDLFRGKTLKQLTTFLIEKGYIDESN